jgi:hypothetical protein
MIIAPSHDIYFRNRTQLSFSVWLLCSETRLLEVRVYVVCQDHVSAEAFGVQDWLWSSDWSACQYSALIERKEKLFSL